MMILDKSPRCRFSKRMAILLAILAASWALPSCRTPPPAPGPSPLTSPSPLVSEDPADAADAAGRADAEAEAKELLRKAQEALDNIHLSEAIRAYVAVLALAELHPSSPRLAEASRSAEAELTKISTRLSIEPVEAWLDADGKQMASTTRSIGSQGALMPMVYLYENFGAGKSPVQDAPIAFEFVKNGGTMTAVVSTDSFGRANTSLSKLNKPGEEAVVRASPLFRSKGKSYRFSAVSRDFSYLPPSNNLVALGITVDKVGNSDREMDVDAFVPLLKDVGFQVLPGAAAASLEEFQAALDGLPGGAERLASARGSGYLALVKVEIYSLNQAELDGVKYGQWFAWAKAFLRILRADGSALASIQVDGIKGGHGSPERAVEAVIKLSREALVKKLEAEMPGLREALLKD